MKGKSFLMDLVLKVLIALILLTTFLLGSAYIMSALEVVGVPASIADLLIHIMIVSVALFASILAFSLLRQQKKAQSAFFLKSGYVTARDAAIELDSHYAQFLRWNDIYVKNCGETFVQAATVECGVEGKGWANHWTSTVLSTSFERVPLRIFLESRTSGHPSIQSFLGKGYRLRRLSLEGDFDQYYTTYAEREDSFLALVFLAPDVMERLIHAPGKFHIELTPKAIHVFAEGREYRPAQLRYMEELVLLVRDAVKRNS
jgi:hypothetical protein